MSLIEKAGQFDVLVSKLPKTSKPTLPASVQKTQDVAKRFEEKLEKLAQIQTFPAPSGKGITAPYVPGTEPAVNQPAPAAPDSRAPETSQKQVNAPAVKEQEKSQVKLTVDPELKEVQKFLNQAMPYNNIKEDGIWGPETSGLVVAWARLNQLPAEVSSALAAAKAQALGNNAVKSIKPGSELGQAQHTASIKNNLTSLADKFESKYSR
jgi:hypothetical protein